MQFLLYLNPKFQASSSFLSWYRSVCVGPGRKPRRPVFSRRGSYRFENLCVQTILYYMRRIVRKPEFCLCENKGADQLRLCFRYTDRTISLLLKSEISSFWVCFCDCTGRFVSDLVGNPEDRFSRVAAHIIKLQ